jgi:hypothetical protein
VAAVAAVICGEVVAQDTDPDEFTHEYQVPAETSCAFTVVAVAGLMVNATASMFEGFDEFSVYSTELTE